MCGIAGYFGTRPPQEARVAACLARMERRGPDCRDFFSTTTPGGATVTLLNARLKILDLADRANQPMRQGALALTYNGELYNHVELREELQSKGVGFATTSDTEVVLQAWAHWGPSALDRLEGMWAFALYDATAGRLFLCRDRFGEKPLYYFQDRDGLFFASEPKCISALIDSSLRVDREQVLRLLVNGYKALHKRPASFFKDVIEVPAASLVEVGPDASDLRRSTYWTLSHTPDEGMEWNDAVAGVRERLVRSVSIRLRADVPLAFCLSGGVDSNAIAGIAKRACGYDVHGFTIVNEDARYDERELVGHAVDELAIRHTAVPLETREFLPRLAAAVRYHDAPVSTIAYYVHWRLMEAIAAAGYRVSVSGTGADELLTGYYDHHLMYLAAVRHDPAIYEPALAAWQRHVLPHVRNPLLQDPELFVANPGFRDHLYFGSEEFAEHLCVPWREPFCEVKYSESLLRNRMLNELFHENVPVLLREDDLNAMYFSIENRSPYLDRALAEFCYRIPTRLLVRDGLAKAVLRAAAREYAPDRVLDNPRKVGFNAPIFALLDNRDPNIREALLADSPIFDLVKRAPIADLLNRHDLPNSLSKFLFSFVSAKVFLEQFE